MTQAESAAYNAGIKAAINAAQIVALTDECSPDAGTFWKRIATETMVAFTDSAKVLMLTDRTEAGISVI